MERPAPLSYKRFLQSQAVYGGELFGNRVDRVSFDSFSRTPAEASLALIIPQNLKWQIKKSRAVRQSTTF